MPVVSLSVPHFKQELPYSCVAACGRMVLAHYGRIYTEDELRRLLLTGPHGTPARNLLLLQSLGFDVQLASFSLAQLGAALIGGVPPIVLVDTGYLNYWKTRCDHVAVLVGLDLESVYLNDPYFDAARQQASLTDFQLAWAANEQLAALIRPTP